MIAPKLYDRALVWDDHCGFWPRVEADLSRLSRLRSAGVDYLSLNVGYDAMPWHEAFKVIAAYSTWLDQHRDDYVRADSVADVLAAKAAGKTAVSFDLEGAHALDGEPTLIATYQRLGVRQMTLAYNRNNAFAGGCHDEDVGLTALGLRAVEEMNRAGVTVDCSHMSRRSTMDAMAASRVPVVFSHSNPIGVWPHERNISDDQIKACAATGGVVGVNGLGIFLGDNDTRTETLVRHVDYLVGLVGPAHVGIGLDTSFGEPPETGLHVDARFWPPGNRYETPDIGYAEPEQLPELAQALLDRGYPEADVCAVLGENFLRVARETWSASD